MSVHRVALLVVLSVSSCTRNATSAGGGDASEPDAGTISPGEPDAGRAAVDAGPPPVVTFAALGDTGKLNAGQRQIAATLAKVCAERGCDFVALLGDNLYESGATSVTDPIFQDRFETIYAGTPAPFWVVLGNHDYGGNGAGNEFFKGQVEVDYTARSSKWHLPARSWHQTFKHVELFGLDTNASLYKLDGTQGSDVAAWMAASTATWKIALGHHPYLSNGPHGNAGGYDGDPGYPDGYGVEVKRLLEGSVCGKAQLYLCGHDHSRQWLSDTCKGTELAVSGAGSVGTVLPGSDASRFQSVGLGLLYVRVEGNTLTAEFLDADGKVEFTRTLSR